MNNKSLNNRAISIVIPVYNSHLSLAPLIQQLNAELPKISSAYEIILVNDGSKDQSWAIILELSKKYPEIIGIDLARNFGQSNAILCGIRHTTHEIIVTMDDDLQHRPSEIINLIQKLEEGYDLVYGKPIKEKHNLGRNISSRATKLILKHAINIPHMTNIHAFRAFRGSLKKSFENFQGADMLIDVLLSWGTTKITHVSVHYDERKLGDSNYNFRKLFTHALNLLIGYSVFPLRFASILGFVFILFGSSFLAWVLFGYFTGIITEPGFTSIVSAIALFSGVQLFSLGIMGEYIARLYKQQLAKPNYLIHQFANSNDDNNEKH